MIVCHNKIVKLWKEKRYQENLEMIVCHNGRFTSGEKNFDRLLIH